MASRFWVGGTGTWDAAATTHWAATSGGGSGASAPSTTDDVIFDALSGGGTVTISGAFAQSVSTSGFTGAFAGSGSLQVTGNVTFASSLTGFTATGSLTLTGVGTLTGFISTTYTCLVNISTAAGNVRTVTNFNVSAEITCSQGVCQLGSDIIASSYRGGASTNKLDFNGHALTLTAGSANVWNLDAGGASTVDMSAVGSSLIIKPLGNINFFGRGLTYTGPVIFQSLSAALAVVTVSGNNIFQNFQATQGAGKALVFNFTIGSENYIEGGGSANPYGPAFTVLGVNEKIIFRSTVAGTQFTLSKTTSPMLLFDCDLKDCIGGGAAAQHISKRGINTSNNTNWVFSGSGMMVLF